MVLVTFSYKTTRGAGGNNLVAFVARGLKKHGIDVHMRNENDQEWRKEWNESASRSDLVVCFRCKEYADSTYCTREYNWVHANDLPNLSINTDDYDKDEFTSKEIVAMILNKLGK